MSRVCRNCHDLFVHAAALRTLGLDSPHSVLTMLSTDDFESFERWLLNGVATGRGTPPSPRAGEPKPRNMNIHVPSKAGSLSEEHVLTVACRHGALQCADVLVRLGTNVNYVGTNGYTVGALTYSVCVCVCVCIAKHSLKSSVHARRLCTSPLANVTTKSVGY